MGRILCKMRGGRASERPQEAATGHSRQCSRALTLFYASDVDYLRKADYTLRSDPMIDKLDKKGGVLGAQTHEPSDRQGAWTDTTVGPGRPVSVQSIFELNVLQSLAHNLQNENGVEVWILPARED